MTNYSVSVAAGVLWLSMGMVGVAQAQAAPDTAAADVHASAMIRQDAPLQYVVKKGDTLWDIAKRFLNNAWQWPQIWYANGQVRNPHLIYPGDVLSLVMVDGHPRLMLGAQTAPPAQPATEAEVKLSPQVRESPLNAAIPTIPIDAIRDFLSSPRVVTREQMHEAPYLLTFLDEHLVAGSGSRAYIKNLTDKRYAGYSLVRMGGPYIDPDNGDLLGYEATPVGDAEVDSYGDPGVVTLTATTREARAGDRLIAVDAHVYDANFYPHAPDKKIDGSILAVFDGVTQIGQYQVVALSRGSRDGLDAGAVLTIMQHGQVARDPVAGGEVKLPGQPAGTVMVFRTTPRVSFALVMDETRVVHVFDRVVTPSATTTLQ
ncbi:MAG TPA: LysM peptidoglycan-binding domain-containing protein [Stenotrophobium sp.]|nr:LysM peptidoglycan-binding domain-containing protein [Stenotrophobium sp.]